MPPARSVAAAAVIAATLALGGCVGRVAAFGDSVTFGYGGAPGGWVGVLEERWGHPIANLGLPGETVGEGARRIDDAFGIALAPDAEVVLVLHGGNDMVRAWKRQPCSETCDPSLVDDKYASIGRKLRKIVDVAENDGRRVVLATYWPANEDVCNEPPEEFAAFSAAIDRLNAEIVELGAELDLPVVRLDELVADLDDDPDNYYDCLHPSGQGYSRIAGAWLSVLPVWAP